MFTKGNTQSGAPPRIECEKPNPQVMGPGNTVDSLSGGLTPVRLSQSPGVAGVRPFEAVLSWWLCVAWDKNHFPG